MKKTNYQDRYHYYKFDNLKRKCGHIEDVNTKTMIGYKPSSKKMEEAVDCKVCLKKKYEEQEVIRNNVLQKAKDFIKNYGIKEECFYEFYGDKSVEVRFFVNL